MLETLRRGIAKILVTALFTVLLLSFALWGIPNFSRDGARAPIATIGKSEVGADEFLAALTQQRAVLAQQFPGGALTPELARQFGLDQRVLGELIQGAAFREHASLLGLRISDAHIAAQIAEAPAFQGGDKKFSRPQFDAYLRQVGFTEARFFAESRHGTQREQLTSALTDGVQASPTLLQIAHKFREESRTVSFITLDQAKVSKPAAPDEAKLKAHYERIKGQFKTGETRAFSVLMLTRDDVKGRIKIEDAEVRGAWEKAQETWNIPERRKFQMVVLKDRNAALAAAKEIAGGKSLFMIALETAGGGGNLAQGPAARREIGDAKVAAQVFALPIDKLSEPIDTRNGFALVRVTEVEPGKVRPFEEIAKDVRASMEQARISEIEKQLHEQIEDRRGTRQPFARIAEELKLKLIKVAGADRDGATPDGKPALDLADAQKLLVTAFEGDKAAIREPIPLTGGGEAWVEVNEITAETQKAFEVVKADVLAIWTDIEHQKAVTAAAEALVERLKAGETLDAVAKSQTLKVETSAPFKRIQPTDKIPASGARLAFTLPKGGAATVENAEKKARVIFVVTDIKAADLPTKEEAEKLAQALQGQLQNDTMATYMTALRNRLGSTLNDVVYRRAVGLPEAPKK